MAKSFEDARALILENIALLGVESIPLFKAVGRVLADDIAAPWDMPRWDNSAMDGFAVRTEDTRLPARLTVNGYIPAGGWPEEPLLPGCAIKIMTGAPIPEGCDAVVPIEETEEDETAVFIRGKVVKGKHIRFRAEDVKAGEVILVSGIVLRPAEISMLASCGMASVNVYRRPRVAILSTGDELVEPGEPLGPGKIVDSNSLALAAAVKEIGAEPILLGIARDNKESLQKKLSEGLRADALITSAGVSVGDRDLVREVLQEMGLERLFWNVNIKPGRPTAFGLKAGKPVFSLPGNPVSSMMTFEAFVRPALLKMMGHKQVIKPYVKAVLQEAANKKPGRLQFLRVRVTREGQGLLASSSGDQNTGILKTLIRANGIAVLPAERGRIEAGEEVDVHLLGPVGTL